MIKQTQGREGRPRGCSLRIAPPLPHNVCDAFLYFSDAHPVLFTGPWWIKLGDYQNIQTKLASRRAQIHLKVKNWEEERSCGLFGEWGGGRIWTGLAAVGGWRGVWQRTNAVLGNISVKCHGVNYGMIEGEPTVCGAIQQERGGYNG